MVNIRRNTTEKYACLSGNCIRLTIVFLLLLLSAGQFLIIRHIQGPATPLAEKKDGNGEHSNSAGTTDSTFSLPLNIATADKNRLDHGGSFRAEEQYAASSTPGLEGRQPRYLRESKPKKRNTEENIGTTDESNEDSIKLLMDQRRQIKPPRLAVVIPYIGNDLPHWFPLFASSCRSSAAIADWLIFTAGETNIPVPGSAGLESMFDYSSAIRRVQMATSSGMREEERGKKREMRDYVDKDGLDWLPSNIMFFTIGISRMARMHAEALLAKGEGSAPFEKRDHAAQVSRASELLAKVLTAKPYALVEFKPALGAVFEAFLEGYSHWCFSDLDLVMGDLVAWSNEISFDIPAADANAAREWDIYTYSFGDQWRMYTRGQWTVHRNTPTVNNAFRACTFMVGDHLLRRLEKGFRYESAEGCYAKVVASSEVCFF